MAARFEQLRSMHESSVAARGRAPREARRPQGGAAPKAEAAKPVGFGPAVRITASGAVLERGTGRLIQGPRAAAAAPLLPSEARPSPPRLFVHQGAANVVGKGPVRALTAAASAPGNFLVGGGVA